MMTTQPAPMAHTPGPWCVENGWLQREEGAYVDGRYFSICVSSTTVADIHLLAAAPDLLEAIKDALKCTPHDGNSYDCGDPFEILSAALAKATWGEA